MESVDTQFATRRIVALQPGMLQAALLDRLTRAMGKSLDAATPRDIYDALSLAVREELTLRWLATQRRVTHARVKRVCYLSVEYLPGCSLLNALHSLEGDFVHEARGALRSMGYELDDIAAQEVDPGLGNGGLGRLAACFLDSLATLQYPAVGYGIRYDYGIFTQVIGDDGSQREIASSWLRLRNVWETPRGNVRYTVRFGGCSEAPPSAEVGEPHRWVDTEDIYAIGFDQLIPGNRGPTVNQLGSGRAAPSRRSTSKPSMRATMPAPCANRSMQRICRASCTRTIRRHRAGSCGSSSSTSSSAPACRTCWRRILSEGRTLQSMPEAIAIQLNDTHPALAIPELMRLLIDEHGLAWAEAWRITTSVFSYTNHTLLPEALETWPVGLFERLLPRHLRDHLPDQPGLFGDGERALPWRCGAGTALVDHHRGGRAASAHGASGGHRQPPRQWRGAAAFRAHAQRRVRGICADVSGAIHQRDQRHRGAALVEAVESRAVGAAHAAAGLRVGKRPRGARPHRGRSRRAGVSAAFSRRQAHQQAETGGGGDAPDRHRRSASTRCSTCR